MLEHIVLPKVCRHLTVTFNIKIRSRTGSTLGLCMMLHYCFLLMEFRGLVRAECQSFKQSLFSLSKEIIALKCYRKVFDQDVFFALRRESGAVINPEACFYGQLYKGLKYLGALTRASGITKCL